VRGALEADGVPEDRIGFAAQRFADELAALGG